MNKPNPQNASARNPGSPPTNSKPEDKDHPDFKKRVALARGPTIQMSYENAAAYDMPESLFTALKDVFESIYAHNSRVGVVSPSRFLEVLRRENEMFRTAMHQDAHEFLNLLLNEVVANVEAHAKTLEEEKSAADNNLETAEGLPEKSEFEMSLMRAMGKSTISTRWVHELFEGVLTSETRCLTCENVSQRDEEFLDLSVDLEEHTSVTSCLRKFSEEEMLCQRNKFHCDGCGGLQEAEKRMKIKRLPKILALHLKRFKYTEDLQRLQKLFHRVVYPYNLRLFNTTDEAEDPDRLYELYAVVVHIGGGPYHGHYISIIKTQDRGWLLFDDEMVEPVDKSYVQNFFGDRPGLACAYVLFYQETTAEAMRKEQDAESQPVAQTSAIAIPKDNVGLGLRTNGTMNGIHHTRSAMPPASTDEGFDSLDKAVTEPPQHLGSPGEVTALPPMPTSAGPAEEVRSKKERAREEKERKVKAREEVKEAEKADKERRKTLEIKRKDILKKQDAQTKAAIEASKQSKAEEDQKMAQQDGQTNGIVNNQPAVSSATAAIGLSRLKSTSKSFKKHKFFGGSKDAAKEELPSATQDGHALPLNNTTNAYSGAAAAATAAMLAQSTTPSSNPSPEKAKGNRFSSLKRRTSQLKI